MVGGGLEVYLLDTSIASAAWDRGHKAHTTVRNQLAQLAQDRIFVSAITLAEIDFGLKVAPSIDVSRQKIVRGAMKTYQILAIDEHTAQPYSDIRATLFKKYSPKTIRGTMKLKYVEDFVDAVSGKQLGIQENDLWIVSLSVQYNYVLITADQGGGMRRVVEAASYQDRTKFWTLN